MRVIQFVPHGAKEAPRPTVIQRGTATPLSSETQSSTEDTSTPSEQPAVKSASTSASPVWHGAALIDSLNLPMLVGSLVLVGGSLFGLRRVS